MRRVAVGSAVSAVLCFVTAAIAQDIEVSSLDIKPISAGHDSRQSSMMEPGYIVDVSGKQVRLVGPRFFPDNSKEVELLGRQEALMREAVRSEVAAR